MRADFSLAVISDRLQALTRAMDADPQRPAKLMLYAAPVPATGQAPARNTLLATLVFSRPALQSVLNKTLTLQNPATNLVAASGVVEWARIENGAGQFVVDLDVGPPGSGAAVVVNSLNNTLNLYAGGEVSVALAKLVEV